MVVAQFVLGFMSTTLYLNLHRFSAVGLDDPRKMLPAVSLVSVCNVLNLPAGSLPVSFYTR